MGDSLALYAGVSESGYRDVVHSTADKKESGLSNLWAEAFKCHLAQVGLDTKRRRVGGCMEEDPCMYEALF